DVACRPNASTASLLLIPQPSSTTRTSARPPARASTDTVLAPASSALSTSSLTTDAGRSITSPAAIWSTTPGGKTAIVVSMGSRYHAPLIVRDLGRISALARTLERAL